MQRRHRPRATKGQLLRTCCLSLIQQAALRLQAHDPRLGRKSVRLTSAVGGPGRQSAGTGYLGCTLGSAVAARSSGAVRWPFRHRLGTIQEVYRSWQVADREAHLPRYSGEARFVGPIHQRAEPRAANPGYSRVAGTWRCRNHAPIMCSTICTGQSGEKNCKRTT